MTVVAASVLCIVLHVIGKKVFAVNPVIVIALVSSAKVTLTFPLEPTYIEGNLSSKSPFGFSKSPPASVAVTAPVIVDTPNAKFNEAVSNIIVSPDVPTLGP